MTYFLLLLFLLLTSSFYYRYKGDLKVHIGRKHRANMSTVLEQTGVTFKPRSSKENKDHLVPPPPFSPPSPPPSLPSSLILLFSSFLVPREALRMRLFA